MYVNFVLQRFHMANCKSSSVPISMGTRLSVKESPTTSSKMEDMVSIPYASGVGI